MPLYLLLYASGQMQCHTHARKLIASALIIANWKGVALFIYSSLTQ